MTITTRTTGAAETPDTGRLTPGTRVRYVGRRTERHDLYTIDGPCCPIDPACDGYSISRPYGTGLAHVPAHSLIHPDAPAPVVFDPSDPWGVPATPAPKGTRT